MRRPPAPLLLALLALGLLAPCRARDGLHVLTPRVPPEKGDAPAAGGADEWEFQGLQAPARQERQAGTEILVLLSQPRSGTSWINSLLAAHPCVLSMGEKRGGYIKQLVLGKRNGGGTREEMLWAAFTPKKKNETWRRCRKRYVMRKIFLQNHLRFNPPGDPEAVKWVMDAWATQGLRFIWLQRWNQLDRAISGLSVREGAALHCTTEGKASQGCANSAFSLPLPEAVDKVVKSQNNLDVFRQPFLDAVAARSNLSLLTVQYETLRSMPPHAVAHQLFDFLGIADTAHEDAGESKFLKRVTHGHAEVVTNLDAVCSELVKQHLDCFCMDEVPPSGRLAGCWPPPQ